MILLVDLQGSEIMQYEQTLLGQMIVDNRIAIDVNLDESDFVSQDNRKIFRAIKDCIDDGLEVDIITVSSKIIGVESYKIASLTNNIVSASNWSFYQSEIKKASTKRKLLQLAETIKGEITDHSPSDMIEIIETEITDIIKDFSNKSSYSFKESMPGFIEELQRRYERKGELPGISTGLTRLDDYILGFQKKFLYYIGARPSGGKSALLLNMAIHAMLKEKKTIGFVSAESSLNEILTRSFSQTSKINSMTLLSGNFDKRTFLELSTFLELFEKSKGYICDEPNMSLQLMKREIRKMVRVNKCDIVFVDYVQLITNKEFDLVRDKVSETSIALKMLARELNIPIVVAAQLRRDSENKRPKMADFADSSQIEKDADVAMMIYHNKKDSWLCIEKARDGKTGDILLFFKKEYVSFHPKEREENKSEEGIINGKNTRW
jgi:replicative DNA helicase